MIAAVCVRLKMNATPATTGRRAAVSDEGGDSNLHIGDCNSTCCRYDLSGPGKPGIGGAGYQACCVCVPSVH